MYTRAWDETTPPGTVLANTIDTIFQNTKTDIRERVAGIFGLSSVEFAADPIVPKTLTLSGDASIAGYTVGRGNLGTFGNTAFGYLTLSGVTAGGVANTGFGFGSLQNLIDAPGNTAVGYGALSSFATGNGANTAVGYQSSLLNTTGTQNAAFGYWALRSTTSGSNNSAVGYRAMMSAVTANYCAIVGYASFDAPCGDFNTGIGGFAGTQNTGNSNTVGGYFTFKSNTSGSRNTTWGYAALRDNVNGSANVTIGAFAGSYELGSNTFYVDNQDRSSTALDKARAMFYGVFDPFPATQLLTINAATTVSQTLAVTGGITANLTGNLTGTIITAAQPNITSVGTLTSLTVSGGGITTSGSIIQNGAAGDNQISGRIRFINLWSGALAAGTIAQHVAHGILINLVSGTTNDLNLAGPTFSSIMRVPTGTLTTVFSAGMTISSGGLTISAGGLNVTGGITGSLTGNVTGNVTGSAGSVAANALTGATLAAGVTGSSLTSVGTLLGLTVNGVATVTQISPFAAGTFKFVSGTTGVSIRNNADTQDNYLFANTGKATFIGDGSGGISIDLLSGGKLAISGTQVVGPRATGFAAPTATFSTTAITNADTLLQTINHLAAVVDALRTHGLIGT